MSEYGKYRQPDVIRPVVQSYGHPTTSVTVPGATRFHFHYKTGPNAPATTHMSIRQAATELDRPFAARLNELRTVIDAMNSTTDPTAHAALEVRRAALED